jgi:hypothetical protein
MGNIIMGSLIMKNNKNTIAKVLIYLNQKKWGEGDVLGKSGGVCRLQMLLALASAVTFGSESHVFYCLRFETSLFVGSYNSQGYGGGIRPRLHTGDSQ